VLSSKRCGRRLGFRMMHFLELALITVGQKLCYWLLRGILIEYLKLLIHDSVSGEKIERNLQLDHNLERNAGRTPLLK
jgi:hypothetical protein